MDLSNFTEDDITCAWLLLKSRLIESMPRINKRCVENIQYPLNVIVGSSIEYYTCVDNAKFIKDYNDIYNIMEGVLSIYEEWFDTLSDLSKDIILLYYKDKKPLSSILDKLNIKLLNEARVLSIKNRMF